MPVGINSLTEGWLELESDPGLFTLLLEDFGVNGVQVEEIYDLQKRIEGHVYGFIFLFRWIDDRRRRRNIVEQTETFVKDEDVVNNIFFAQQIVHNSCATHALLSVLLNCPNIHLGDTLSRLKAHTTGMCPENKGWAIGNTPELAKAHNSHAMPQARRCVDKTLNIATGATTGRYTGETYHFVSYVPIQGKLFELDGLKPFPMDHGPWGESESWTEKFRQVIIDRLESAQKEQSHDIRFNLMAVVPDRRIALTRRLTNLKTNRQIASEAFQQVVRNSQAKAKEESENTEKKENDSKIEIQDNMFEKETQNNDEKTDNSSESQYFLQKPFLETRNATKIELMGMPNIDAVSDKVSQPSLDYSMPLTVQTSPVPSCSSTDTSSEVGSAFNSPTQGWGWNSGQNSPMSTKDLKKLVVVRVSTSENDTNQHTSSRKRDNPETLNFVNKKVVLDTPPQNEALPENSATSEKKDSKIHCKLFASPSDYIIFLKNLENEIRVCEANLREENEKRKQYKIDDCRRTHNYDEFICTFLSMLAQQGKLADLVQQQLSNTKVNHVPVTKVHTVIKKPTPPHTTPRRRRNRAKCRRRK